MSEWVSDKLKIEERSSMYGSGVYGLGENRLRVFITMGGNVMAVEGRAITAEDLMTAYQWGRLEQQALTNPPAQDGGEDLNDE